MKNLLPLIFTLVLSFSIFSQSPTEWKGLALDQATPEKAIEVLGKPKTDKTDNLLIYNPKWVTKKTREKEWRVLHYENVEGFPDVKLAFDSNSKLVLIHLEPKKIKAQSLLSAYPDLEFRFADEVMSPADFKYPRREEKTSALGAVYVMVAVSDKSFVFASIGNATGSVMSGLFGGTMARKTGRSVSGDVAALQLVSRTLENKDNTDLLK